MQTYCNMLALPPFPFWRLEAAVAPGPATAEHPAATAALGKAAEVSLAEDADADAISPTAENDNASGENEQRSRGKRGREVCTWGR